MPLQYVSGDLLSSGADVLVIPVNCVGVAGKGLALQCKQRYPQWYRAYCAACRPDAVVRLSPGHPVAHCVASRWFLNFPTKEDWRSPAALEYIEWGLQALMTAPGPLSLVETTVAFPQLGCGAGGLSWAVVQPVMERFLHRLPCTSLIYVH